jgi:DNA mismatch endonuclease, patch repair protein
VSRTVNLGQGRRVPYPEPTSLAATKVGKANRRTGTMPEVALRSALHRGGLRFRTDFPIQLAEVRVRPDIVFTRKRVAVFVDGCFWHCCPAHGVLPAGNRAYWEPKLAANVDRDRRVDAALRNAGWSVLRVWEHEETDTAAEAVVTAVNRRTGDRISPRAAHS